MGMHSVSIVRGKDSSRSLLKSLELIGGTEAFFEKNDHVIIKPNICGGVQDKVGTYTSIDLITALVKELHGKVQTISIAEANSSMYLADKMFELNGINAMADTLGIDVINLSEGPFTEVPIEGGYTFDKISVNEALIGAKLISMPVAKTHCTTEVTINLKNMFGVLPARRKGKYHKRIDAVLADLNKALPPTLCVVDATTCLEGEGPFHGNTVDLGLVVTGSNSVAVDSVMARIMGFDPQKIMHIRLASEQGLGPKKMDDIEVLGESITSVARTFERAPPENISRPLSWIPGIGHLLVHYYYETAVRDWKKQTR